jgi:peptidoglycan-associated lipoprotein
MKKLLMSLLAAMVLAACSSTPTKEQDGAAVEDRTASTADPKPATKPADTGVSTKPIQPGGMSGDPLTNPSSILFKRSVYFDFDSNIVKDEFKPTVAAHAKYLMQNASSQMRIEGSADERGSREYNLALGQRRADAVRQMMQLLGAPVNRIETVSFGEEKPKAAGHDEAAWAENRRADIKYKDRGE